MDYRKIFKLQLNNFLNELINIYNDEFIKNVQIQIIEYMEREDFYELLGNYFTKDFENKIKNRDMKSILKSNQLILPTSKENIILIRANQYWNKMSENTKANCWRYIDSLIEIFRKIK